MCPMHGGLQFWEHFDFGTVDRYRDPADAVAAFARYPHSTTREGRNEFWFRDLGQGITRRVSEGEI